MEVGNEYSKDETEEETTPSNLMDKPEVDSGKIVIREEGLQQTQGASENREPIFANSLIRSFIPYKKLMRFFLRFPFNVLKLDTDGSYSYTFTFKSFVTIGFLMTSCIILLETFFFVMNIVVVLLNMPNVGPYKYTSQDSRKNYNGSKTYQFDGKEMHAMELYILHRNLVPVLIILSCLIHSSISNVIIFFRRKFLCAYYTFWTTAVELMRIHAAVGVAETMSFLAIYYVFFLMWLILFYMIAFAPVTKGTGSVFTLLTFRIMCPHIHLIEHFWILRGFLGIFVLYIFVNSKSTIILFFWTCRLLRNSFEAWNHRLDGVLHKGESMQSRADKVAKRTGYDHLFKDHACLLDLIDGADVLFANTVESYYVSTVISICFEIFYFIRSLAAKDEFPGARSFDGIVILWYLIHTCVIMFLVTWSAAKISDEALNGLEVIRRKGIMGRKEDDELYFMISMYVSYSGHFDTALSCGGYFVLDKRFLVGLFGTVVSYFIVVMQFTPPLTMKSKTTMSMIKDIPTLITITEEDGNLYDNGQSFNVNITDPTLLTSALSLSSFKWVNSSFGESSRDDWNFEHDMEFLEFLHANNNFTIFQGI